MNLADAVLTTDGHPALTLAEQTVRITEGLAQRLKTGEGPVTVGVRPQHVEVLGLTPTTPSADPSRTSSS
jgi:oligogalacturonide transport system ATP-binding protein